MYSLSAVILIAAAFFVYLLSINLKKSSGLPEGRVVFSDSHKRDQTGGILFDKSIGLAGNPDYIVKKGKEIIPVEVKSNTIKFDPYDSHIFQLMAYCRLLHVHHNIRPSYGLLQYSNRSFKIEYTQEMEERLLDLVETIRAQRIEQHRSHQTKARCIGCIYAGICDEKLM